MTTSSHTYRTRFTLVLLFLASLPSCFCGTDADADADAVYRQFLKCFARQTHTPIPAFSDTIYTQSNASYTAVLRAYIRNARFNTSSSPKPSIIVTPRREDEVRAAVICSRALNFLLKVRSGGHDYEGVSYVSDSPFFILDMFNFRSVSVNIADESAWVGSGALLGEVYYRIWEKSKVHGYPAGVCPTVGIGGHISGAGYGNLLRKYGLTVDHVVDAKIVDVNGRILDRRSMGEDLFWAIKGGGAASFGVVLGYKIKLVSVPKTVTVFRVERLREQNAVDFVHKWQFVAPKTDPNLFMRLLLQPVTRNKKKTVRASVVALYLGTAEDVVSILAKEFPELGLMKENCTELSWIQSVLWWDNDDNPTTTNPNVLLDRNLDSAKPLKRKSDYVDTEISKDGLNFLFDKLIEVGKVGLVFNPYGGKMSEVPESETPFAHRNKLWKIQYSVNWNEPGREAEEKYLKQARTLHGHMTRFVTKNPRSAYLNYRDLDIGVNDHGKNSYEEGEVYGRKYFGKNFDRLVKVKTAVDPGNFFRNEQSIPCKARRN